MERLNEKFEEIPDDLLDMFGGSFEDSGMEVFDLVAFDGPKIETLPPSEDHMGTGGD